MNVVCSTSEALFKSMPIRNCWNSYNLCCADLEDKRNHKMLNSKDVQGSFILPWVADDLISSKQFWFCLKYWSRYQVPSYGLWLLKRLLIGSGRLKKRLDKGNCFCPELRSYNYQVKSLQQVQEELSHWHDHSGDQVGVGDLIAMDCSSDESCYNFGLISQV